MTRTDAGTPDEILVVAAILGDLAAFDELVRRYRPAVVRTAQMLVSREDAEDVAQEALLLAFKALPSLEAPNKFPAWLYAITRRCAIRFSQRTRLQSRGSVAFDEAILEQVPALVRPMPEEEAGKELQGVMDSIPQNYALALRLHFLDEMPLKRIAGFLGTSLPTVKWRIHRGKKLLRSQFESQKKRSKKWIKRMN